MQAILLDSSAVVNNTCWIGVVSPPASAADHRRQSASSAFQQWDDSIISCTSEIESPDQSHEAFTPPLHSCHTDTAAQLLNAKYSDGSNPYDGHLIGHGLPATFSSVEDTARFDFTDHDENSPWTHVANTIAGFRPARMPSISHDSILHAPAITPTISASSSFGSGIRVHSPSTPDFMQWGQDGDAHIPGDASMPFCETLPTPPVIPSQTMADFSTMPTAAIYRQDSSFSTAMLSDFHSDSFTSCMGLDASPVADHYPAGISRNPAPSRGSRRKSRKVARRKAKHANEVIFDNIGRPCALDSIGRTIPLPPDGRGGYKAQNPVRRRSKVYCTEPITNHTKIKNGDGGLNGETDDDMCEYEEICGQAFDTKEKLKRHKDAKHSDERPYKCPVKLTDENGDPILDENGEPVFCTLRGSQSSRKCNSGDHVSKHVVGWIKQFDEYKTKGSSRTPPLVSPEDMQEMVIAQSGLENSLGPRGILTQLWRRIQGSFDWEVDDRFCFPLLLDEDKRAPRRDDKRIEGT